MKKWTYDPQADAAYAYGHATKIHQTKCVSSYINVDVSIRGRVVGIEILNAKEILSNALGKKLSNAQLKKMRYSIEEKRGLYLRIACEGSQASLVFPSHEMRLTR